MSKPIFDSIKSNKYNPGKTDFSPSNIMMGAKEYYGKKLLSKNTPTDVSNLWSAHMGSLIHRGLEELLKEFESADGKYELEIHKEIEFEGKVLGGTVDGLFYGNDGTVTLFDYKTLQGKQFISDDKIEEWTYKANFYRYVLHKAGIEIDTLVYIGIWRDWSKAAFMRSNREFYPTQSITLDIWEYDKTEAWIKERIMYFAQYKDTPYQEIPPCTEKERWQSAPQWKVGKLDSKGVIARAYPKCTFDDIESAKLECTTRNSTSKGVIAGVKEINTDPIKCLNYCDCSKICGFVDGKK